MTMTNKNLSESHSMADLFAEYEQEQRDAMAPILAAEQAEIDRRRAAGLLEPTEDDEDEPEPEDEDEGEDEDDEDEAKMTYTVTIYDATQDGRSEGSAWPSHEGIELDATDLDSALAEAEEELYVACRGLRKADGYTVGDTVAAIVSDSCGRTYRVSHRLTEEDVA